MRHKELLVRDFPPPLDVVNGCVHVEVMCDNVNFLQHGSDDGCGSDDSPFFQSLDVVLST